MLSTGLGYAPADHLKDGGVLQDPRLWLHPQVWTGDLVFVNRRSVKRVSQLEYNHNLNPGKWVEFAKGMGPKGFWAVWVTWLSDFPTSTESERRGRPFWSCMLKTCRRSLGILAVPPPPAAVSTPVTVTRSPNITIQSATPKILTLHRLASTEHTDPRSHHDKQLSRW